ncbi:MAG TPA: ABC transporter permease subunit [Candidatus Merdicola faecigallinarum]|uniref:ABC transporter permease subunit n=1 Tax=Candidatus Merdicola faecigallinarum TaxID=2840862 RepID=A0A9D1S9H1_9FIRM|nr:ABC transporter permease subunit [Candidatus Merdicola faecigallinarum]
MFAIIKKEVKSYFLSPIGYVFIGLFLFMASIFFYLDVIYYGSTNFEYMFYSLSTILTFITPILTMRMFAEERKEGTDQLLFTSPVSISNIVFGKFLSAVIILVITELFTFLYYGILLCFGAPHLPTALVTLLGFLLLGTAYISFGMFASSLTENQIIAGITTIAFFILTWFMPQFSEGLEAFSLMTIFNTFPSGQLAINEIVTFLSFTLLFILLTIIVLQRKKSVK